MNSFRTGWYLLYTRPRQEKKVHDHLTEKQINSFLPTTKTLRIWHDRKKCVVEPLFPSYVFVYLNNLQDYYGGIGADGSLHYVKIGKEAARVSDTVINNVKVATGQTDDLEVSDKPFLPGKQLVITNGALTGLSCEVVEYKCKQKLLVRVDLLQRNLLLTLPDDHLTDLKQSLENF